ncbi:hypothetical protein C9J01_06630 [Photobacterium rosenbergii]|uniref:Uncharacterized protein n=1 Tax=Photobacterium rosenbergii TaxID=294936 RepID=A0A2T3NMB3_9GAMM|nr:hypothetical protein C9J01_06630 [Photobacterium rosenbergii]
MQISLKPVAKGWDSDEIRLACALCSFQQRILPKYTSKERLFITFRQFFMVNHANQHQAYRTSHLMGLMPKSSLRQGSFKDTVTQALPYIAIASRGN